MHRNVFLHLEARTLITSASSTRNAHFHITVFFDVFLYVDQKNSQNREWGNLGVRGGGVGFRVSGLSERY